METYKAQGHCGGIVWINGGRSHVGTDRPEIKSDGESPKRPLKLSPFGMSDCAVTNAEFACFTESTGYKTDAERLGWSFVFRGLLDASTAPKAPDAPWWSGVADACWAQPTGPGSSWTAIADHPVVHVSYDDAAAYASWVGGRLPSEAEWEHAARGGAQAARYPWGDVEPDDYEFQPCNIWQGAFPETNTCQDGHFGTAPAASFEPNSLGLFNMSGNVWEWCADRFRIRSLAKADKKRNKEAQRDKERVLKGGSFLCHQSYCWRYRIAARAGRQPDNSASHCGFRVVFDRQS